MDIKDIPVRVIGPGSQPAQQGDALSYIDMPGDMSTYQAPLMPDPASVEDLDGARNSMAWLKQALRDCGDGSEPRIANISDLDARSRELVNQILGEGEVSITLTSEFDARVQESVLAGVWRTFYLDEHEDIVMDLLEVAAVPHVARARAPVPKPIDTSAAPDIAAKVPNALPILVELEAAREAFEANRQKHSINLSLLPMSDEELAFLDERLGRGPVDILSRAYGKCQVISTRTENVWWVRYYNSMGTLILNTLEVVDMPQIVAAAPEDLADSVKRLDELLEPYWSDVA